MITIRLRRPRISEEDKLKIITDYLAGLPLKEIASRYSTTVRTISRVITNARREQLN